MAGTNAFDSFITNYSRRYIRTGSGAPVFHIMGALFFSGVLMHAKHHRDVHNDPKAAH